MTKIELAKEVAVSEKLSLFTTVKALDGIIRVIRETLSRREDVYLSELGALVSYDCEERVARNPKTGESTTIPAHRSVKFRVGKNIIDYLNPSDNG